MQRPVFNRRRDRRGSRVAGQGEALLFGIVSQARGAETSAGKGQRLMTGMKLKGAADLSAFLDALPKTLVKNAVRSALTAAAKPIKEQARANVPKKTGKLAQAIKTGRPRANQDGTVSVRVKVEGEHSFLAPWVEFGTAAHVIAPGDSELSPRQLNKRIKRDGSTERDGKLVIGNNVISGAVMHPGTPARPFLRPALDTRATDAVNAFGERMQTYLRGNLGVTLPLVEVDEEE